MTDTKLGWLVQARIRHVEEGFQVEGEEWVHAEPGNVGHVVGVEYDRVHCESVYMIFWEHKRTSSSCYGEELLFLGGPETGKTPPPLRQEAAPVRAASVELPAPLTMDTHGTFRAFTEAVSAETNEDFQKAMHRWNMERWAELRGLPGIIELTKSRSK